MRDIRQCRIWNPHTNSFEYSGGTPMMQSSFFKQTATLLTVDEQRYEYQTGLKDAYAGDLYEININPENTETYCIVWLDGCACFALRQCGKREYLPDVYGPDFADLIENNTPIGNIHENPDILKGESQ